MTFVRSSKFFSGIFQFWLWNLETLLRQLILVELRWHVHAYFGYYSIYTVYRIVPDRKTQRIVLFVIFVQSIATISYWKFRETQNPARICPMIKHDSELLNHTLQSYMLFNRWTLGKGDSYNLKCNFHDISRRKLHSSASRPVSATRNSLLENGACNVQRDPRSFSNFSTGKLSSWNVIRRRVISVNNDPSCGFYSPSGTRPERIAERKLLPADTKLEDRALKKPQRGGKRGEFVPRHLSPTCHWRCFLSVQRPLK